MGLLGWLHGGEGVWDKRPQHLIEGEPSPTGDNFPPPGQGGLGFPRPRPPQPPAAFAPTWI